MDRQVKFTSEILLKDVISADPSLLMVMARFGIPLGFGDRSVGEVCAENGIELATFLTTINFMSGRSWNADDVEAGQLMTYLMNAHEYFLDFVLPMIRRKLIGAIDCSSTDELGFLILRFYDEYVTEVKKHMQMENAKVFPYVEKLLKGEFSDGFRIEKFASHHSHIDPKLKELKDIIIRYYPGKGNDLLNSVLFDIITCEHDLRLHCMAEDRLFVPAVKKLEAKAAEKCGGVAVEVKSSDQTYGASVKASDLSEREREIVWCVAKGMSNKEIASHLCLSVHTVTTHRRNISAKLQIHSTAGITIFAIVNGLLTPDEIGVK
ncbi:MAG: helix-turn-helix transcriptional regulator [Bacteroidales bacterium]|nr:helix-turn-helix transcriptional regulator [Bacteroidales bacterium]